MSEAPLSKIKPPRLVDGPALLVAGLSERYTYESSAGIPAQWQRFGPYIGHIPGQKGDVAYGVCYNADEAGNMEYLCGVEVDEFSSLPKELTRLRIAAHRYAVFTHAGHVSSIRQTWMSIFDQWMPASGYGASDAPSFERYDARFDPRTGSGGLEIWIPVDAAA